MGKISFYISFLIFVIYSNANINASPGDHMSFKFTIEEFADKGKIPVALTCDGNDQIPTLKWQNPPKGTTSFAMIMDDPDAPVGTWDHWLVFNIPANVNELSSKQPLPDQAMNGKNSWGNLNYGGPCPPDREHRYFFTLYALDTKLNLPSGAKKSQILKAMEGHILEKLTVIGLYNRIKK